ncbi:hypothetical protein Avbf_07648 [Armadillidium vulgare]|nr:hypothetical protein Avbf_07648 [Armadillidium vulgare]
MTTQIFEIFIKCTQNINILDNYYQIYVTIFFPKVVKILKRNSFIKKITLVYILRKYLVMVILHVKRESESSFLYETNLDTLVEDTIKSLVEVYNGRLKVEEEYA